MITLRHTDGRTIDLTINDPDARSLKPALAPGWAFGRMQQIEAFVGLDGDAATAPATRTRTSKPIAEPALAVRESVRAALAKPGTLSAITPQCMEYGSDTVHACLKWMVQTGAATLKGKTYTLAAQAAQQEVTP